MIRNGSQLSAGHQLGTGGLPVAGGDQINPPKGRWLVKTDHFSVSYCSVPGADFRMLCA